MKQPTKPSEWGRLITACLTPELLKPQFRVGGKHRLFGHCYVASEALFHLVGGHQSDYLPCRVRHEGATHWFLRHKKTRQQIDLTKAQFQTPVPYDRAVGCGFLTHDPSKRAQVVMARVREKLAS